MTNDRSAAYPVFYKGQQIIVRAKDKLAAKLAVYAAYSEAKWNEIK